MPSNIPHPPPDVSGSSPTRLLPYSRGMGARAGCTYLAGTLAPWLAACSTPAARLTAGAPCSAPGTACTDPNIPAPEEGLPVLGLRLASCSGGRWTAATESVGSHCPPVEPAASDPCNAGDECEWENPCRTWTSGTCIGGVWSKGASPCPGTPLESCTSGAACEPRVNCTGSGCPTYPYCSCSDGGLQCMTASCLTP
jgi:hypothetical protein